MALYGIGDLHLSLGADKPMDIFGGLWKDHQEKLREAFSPLGPEDVCVILGDLSWSMGLEAAAADFHFLDELGGQKLLLKGNHDYWWNTAAKIESFFRRENIRSVRILHNNCYTYGDLALCGTRGWFFEEETGKAHDRKILQRELMRLEASLKAAGERQKLCFLHYPPRYGDDYVCREICQLLRQYGVEECYYGHLHGKARTRAVEGPEDGVRYALLSADHLDFRPRLIREEPGILAGPLKAAQ